MAFQVSGDTVIDQNQSITSPKITLEGTSASESILSGLLNGDSKLEIKADGEITSSNNIVANAFISPNNGNTTRLLIQNETGDVIILDKDGNATFDGSVESKNNFFVKAQADDQTCFRVTDLSGGTIRTNLRGDGGAEFASTVKIGNPSNPEIELTGSGNATFAGFVKSTNGSGTSFLGASSTAGLELTNSGGSTSAKILYDGSAEFAGGLFNLAANGGLTMGSPGTDNGVVLSMIAGTNPAPSAYTLFQGIQSDGTTQAFAFKVDGSATFAGSVDVAGLTVNGAPVSGDVDLSGYDTSAEVDQKIANLVGTASSTLDTLGEIADALSDNQSVATSITVQLGLKANTSSLANVATSGSYTDLTNKPSIPTHTSSLTNNSGFITNTNSTFPSSYYEFGNGTGSVSNDGSWNARLNLAGSSHARLDVKSVSDGIITSIFSHTGNGAGRIGTSSDHPLKLMVGGNNYATLSTSGVLDTFSQGTLWGSSNDGSGSGLDADKLDGQEGSYYLNYNNLTNKPVINIDGGDAATLDGIDSSQFLRSDTADTATGTLTVRDIKLSSGYHLQRSDHHSGHLEGSYNNVGANSTKSNPIYTIGSGYNPSDESLDNMYGIGYTHADNSPFVSGSGITGWGMYVAADGDARVFLDGSSGTIWSSGNHYVGSNRVLTVADEGSGNGLDADTLDGLQSDHFIYRSSLDGYYKPDTWIDFGPRGDTSGLYWSTGGAAGWHIYPQSTSSFFIRSGHSSAVQLNLNTNGTTRGYVYANSSDKVGFLDKNSAWRFSAPGPQGNSLLRDNTHTIWDSGNDGSGSGLDADKLDGQEGSYYLNYNNLSNKPSIPTHTSSLTNNSDYQTSAQVDAKVSALETSLTAGAPGALDTLNELAAALGDDANFASTITSQLSTINTQLSGKITNNLSDIFTIQNNAGPNSFGQLNIGSTGSGETRAIDIDGNWSANENKSISFTHGSSASDLVGQINCQHNSPGSRIRFGKLYHSGNSNTYTMELVSSSTTTADLHLAGNFKTNGKFVSTNGVSSSAPSNPNTGDFWTDTSSDPPILKSWNGSSWIEVGSAGGSSQTAPVINSVGLTDDNATDSNRFTGSDFTVTATMFADGAPVSQKGLKATVEGTFQTPIDSVPVTGKNITTYDTQTQPWSTTESYSPVASQPSAARFYYYMQTDGGANGYGMFRLRWYSQNNSYAIWFMPDPTKNTYTNLGSFSHTKGFTIGAICKVGNVFWPATYGSTDPQTLDTIMWNNYATSASSFHRPSYDGDFSLVSSGWAYCSDGEVAYRFGPRPTGNRTWVLQMTSQDIGSGPVTDSNYTWITIKDNFTLSGNPVSDVNQYQMRYNAIVFDKPSSTLIILARERSQGETTDQTWEMRFNVTQGDFAHTRCTETYSGLFLSQHTIGFYYSYDHGCFVMMSNAIHKYNFGTWIKGPSIQSEIYSSKVGFRADGAVIGTNQARNGAKISYDLGVSWQDYGLRSGGTDGGMNGYGAQQFGEKDIHDVYLTTSAQPATWYRSINSQVLFTSPSDISNWSNNEPICKADDPDNKEYWGFISNINYSGGSFRVHTSGLWSEGDVVRSKSRFNSGQATRYLVLDSSGNVLNHTGDDPGFVEQGPGTTHTLKFPQFFPSGKTPDAELLAGTVMRAELQATNSAASDTYLSNAVTPT